MNNITLNETALNFLKINFLDYTVTRKKEGSAIEITYDYSGLQKNTRGGIEKKNDKNIALKKIKIDKSKFIQLDEAARKMKEVLSMPFTKKETLSKLKSIAVEKSFCKELLLARGKFNLAMQEIKTYKNKFHKIPLVYGEESKWDRRFKTISLGEAYSKYLKLNLPNPKTFTMFCFSLARSKYIYKKNIKVNFDFYNCMLEEKGFFKFLNEVKK